MLTSHIGKHKVCLLQFVHLNMHSLLLESILLTAVGHDDVDMAPTLLIDISTNIFLIEFFLILHPSLKDFMTYSDDLRIVHTFSGVFFWGGWIFPAIGGLHSTRHYHTLHCYKIECSKALHAE